MKFFPLTPALILLPCALCHGGYKNIKLSLHCLYLAVTHALLCSLLQFKSTYEWIVCQYSQNSDSFSNGSICSPPKGVSTPSSYRDKHLTPLSTYLHSTKTTFPDPNDLRCHLPIHSKKWYTHSSLIFPKLFKNNNNIIIKGIIIFSPDTSALIRLFYKTKASFLIYELLKTNCNWWRRETEPLSGTVALIPHWPCAATNNVCLPECLPSVMVIVDFFFFSLSHGLLPWQVQRLPLADPDAK